MKRIATILTALVLAFGLTAVAAPVHAEEPDPRDERIAELEAQVAALTLENEALTAQVNELAPLRHDVAVLTYELTVAREDNAVLTSAYDDLASQNHLLIARVEVAELDNRILSDRVSRLRDKVASLRLRLLGTFACC